MELVADLTSYDWDIRILKSPLGANVPMLAGWPKQKLEGKAAAVQAQTKFETSPA